MADHMKTISMSAHPGRCSPKNSTDQRVFRTICAPHKPITRALVQFGTLHPARRLIRADRVRAELRRAVARAFQSTELLAWPTNPAPAPPIAAPLVQLPSGPSLADAPNVRQAMLANLAGVPGISVPVGMHSSGLPIGLQLLAPWGHEARLLDAAEQLERATGRRWADATPPLVSGAAAA